MAILALFGLAFGFNEAATLLDLRASSGLLPGYNGTLADVIQQSSEIHEQAQLIAKLPESLYTIEFIREIFTMIMLISISILSSRFWPERFVAFLWTFAIWDSVYYCSLWITIRWPSSLLDYDFLFFVPIPWYSQVWYPLLVSTLTIITVLLLRKSIEI